jgi:TfoX/Sxy family transcriptional regulator of competence genes
MPYDERLAERIRRALPASSSIAEKRMFGGLAFLRDGKMFVGVSNDDLMVRVGPAAYEDALARPHARPMDFTGRPLTGYVFVGAAGTRTDKAVAAWVEQALSFVGTLQAPAKKPARKHARSVREDARSLHRSAHYAIGEGV